MSAVLGPQWRDWRQPDFWVIPLIWVGLAMRLAPLLRPFDTFVSIFPADDFYYYANTAYHLAQGHGSTFDGGLTFHNGYHPLFMWLLVPGFWIGIGKTGMVYVAMALLSLASLAMLVLAQRIGRRLGADWGSLVVPLVIAVGGYYVHQSLWGFETPLATAFVLATILATLHQRSPVLIGVLLGLAILARIDNGILAIPLGLTLWHRRGLRVFATTAAFSLLVTLPWWVWSLASFGTFIPISGLVKAMNAEPSSALQGFLTFARESTGMILGDVALRIMPGPIPLVASIAAVAAGIWAGRREPWLLGYVALTVLVFAALTSPNQPVQFIRYCSTAAIVLAILVFSIPWPCRRVWLPLVALLIVFGGVKYLRWSLVTPERNSFKAICQQRLPGILADVVRPGDLVGAFDSGAAGYFAPCPIVNLDGLVNAELVTILRADEGGGWDRRYRRYLHEKKITILVGAVEYSWSNILPEYTSWPELHDPIPSTDGGEVVILRIPEHIASDH